MRKQLVFYLKNFPGLNALNGDRVYAQRAPTSASLPYVTITVEGLDPDYYQNGEDGRQLQTFNIISNGATLAAAADAALQVKKALNIQQQQIGDTGKKEFLFSTTMLGEFDNFDLFDGSQEGVRKVEQTFNISYKES